MSFDFFIGLGIGVAAVLLWQHFKTSPKTAPAAQVIEANLDALGQIIAASEQRILGRLEDALKPAEPPVG